MPTKITQAEAKDFVTYYHEACESKGEDKNEVTRYYQIERSAIEEIFAKADQNNIPCEGLRIYLAKKGSYNPGDAHPKFSSKDNYNLVIVGVDDKGANILSTYEIHDYLSSVAGPPTASDF
ncbi:MAG: hypothetical protein EOO01_31110 [Chitinophagaceae bacterium]|nr:MAG: hypothetical protein EOO01_31110 [Chitinophagaceae bacterium]